MNVMKRSALAVATALFALSAPLEAQQAGTDSRWLPFVGCWEAVGGEDEIGLLCFRLEGEGVTLTNYVGGEVASSEQLVADGRRQQVSAEGCEGYETVTFSSDGRRAFTDTEFLCGTDEPRTGTGVMTFLGPDTWADIRTLHAGDEPFAWVQEYRLAGAEQIAEAGVDNPAEGLGMAVRTARAAAATRLDLDDVIEASQVMDEKAVETWLVARRDRFAPTGEDLIRLADAGVPEAVIDAVVAVSHPEKFYVALGDPPEEYEGAPRPTHYRGYMGFSPFWGPAWGLSFGYGYAPYRPGWGYPYPGYGYGYWGYRPGYVVISPQPQGGRIYNGRGYSSGRSGSSSPAYRGGRRAQPRGGGSSPSYSRGGSSGGSAAPASSRSGGRQATPRRAQRRPSGGR